MTFQSTTELVIQVAQTAMMVFFATEVTIRAACITWSEVRKAWKLMRQEGGEK